MFATDFTAETKKVSWAQFRKNFCPPEYREKCEEWTMCKDAFAGEDAVQEKGAKYLYKPESKAKTKAWDAYRMRAKFPTDCKDTLLKMCGITGSAEPSVVLPEDLEYLREWATSDHGGLIALKNRVMENVLKFGRYHLLLQVGDKDAGNNLFYVSHFAPEKFLDCDYDTENGESYLTWVLLDDSDVTFDKKSKKRDFNRQLLVLGLDARGYYYQAKIKPEDWEDFNLDEPTGDVVYPAPFGVLSNRIPFFVFNVTDRSFAHYQKPPMIDLIHQSFHIYNADAPYQQTLFMTSDPTLVRKGMPKGAADPKLGSDTFNDIPAEANMLFLEFGGQGAKAQLENIVNMQNEAQKMGVSIAGIEGAANASGVALEIVRNAQTAALRIITANICTGIENLLRFAFEWLNPSADAVTIAEEVKFSPNYAFAETKADASSVLAVATRRREIGMTKEEMRQYAEKNLGLEHKDFDELQAELDAEDEAKETANFAGMNLAAVPEVAEE